MLPRLKLELVGQFGSLTLFDLTAKALKRRVETLIRGEMVQLAMWFQPAKFAHCSPKEKQVTTTVVPQRYGSVHCVTRGLTALSQSAAVSDW